MAAALALAAGAHGHFQSGLYSHERSDCSSRIDPITVVFYHHASAARTLNHVRKHTGWSGGDGGGQYFASHGICGPGGKHAESGTFTRYHMRMKGTQDDDATWGRTTTGTPHHEDWVLTCNYGLGGHAVDKGGVGKGEGLPSGFDQGRSRIYDALLGKQGHDFAGSANWGNTQEFKQCDGDYAGSHGHVYWFRIPKWAHDS